MLSATSNYISSRHTAKLRELSKLCCEVQATAASSSEIQVLDFLFETLNHCRAMLETSSVLAAIGSKARGATMPAGGTQAMKNRREILASMSLTAAATDSTSSITSAGNNNINYTNRISNNIDSASSSKKMTLNRGSTLPAGVGSYSAFNNMIVKGSRESGNWAV